MNNKCINQESVICSRMVDQQWSHLPFLTQWITLFSRRDKWSSWYIPKLAAVSLILKSQLFHFNVCVGDIDSN